MLQLQRSFLGTCIVSSHYDDNTFLRLQLAGFSAVVMTGCSHSCCHVWDFISWEDGSLGKEELQAASRWGAHRMKNIHVHITELEVISKSKFIAKPDID